MVLHFFKLNIIFIILTLKKFFHKDYGYGTSTPTHLQTSQESTTANGSGEPERLHRIVAHATKPIYGLHQCYVASHCKKFEHNIYLLFGFYEFAHFSNNI